MVVHRWMLTLLGILAVNRGPQFLDADVEEEEL